MSVYDKYQPVIGLEVHCQLSTFTKAFAPDLNEYGSMPNTNISMITLAHPGAMPRSNKKAVEFSIKMGLACNSEITRYNYYDRKQYFYPDLPKGYQTTQDKTPICIGGKVGIKVDGVERMVQLNRIHMEEDAGKSQHLNEEVDTLVDLNRAGVPLIEIVSEPDLWSSDEAYAFLTEIRKIVRYLEICDGNMEEGSLRCDANISVMLKGSKTLGKKVEVKNMNSFKNVQRAIDFEVKRQIDLIEEGEDFASETRLFDANTGLTHSMRSKEGMNDYRYFPEPDLQPIVVSEQWLASIKAEMPPLPHELLYKFVNTYSLPEYDSLVLTDAKDTALFFEEICKHTTNYKAASNWMLGSIKSYLNELTLSLADFKISPKYIADLIALIDSNKVSNTAATQKIFPEMVKDPSKTPLQVAESLDLLQNSDSGALTEFVNKAIASYPDEVLKYKAGKKNLIGLFMGEVMKLSGGKADPKVTSELVRKALEV